MRVNNLGEWNLDDSAFIIIDMQNDFVEKKGSLYTPGALEIVDKIAKIKKWLKRRNVPVFYTTELHRKNQVDYGMEMVNGDPLHCQEGSWGAEIVQGLEPEPDDYVIVKRRYSSFNMTDLDMLLRALKKSRLIIVGVTTDVCVYATALDASQREIHPLVFSDCVVGTSEEQHHAFLKNIGDILGEVTDTESFIQMYN